MAVPFNPSADLPAIAWTGSLLGEFVPTHKWLFCPTSTLCEKFYPRNINRMPPVKSCARLDLDQNPSFLDGHELGVAAAGFEYFIGIDNVLNQSMANNILPGKVNELYGLDRR